jgi:hypothetical protein
MNTLSLKKKSLVLVTFLFFLALNSKAQTSGTLTFTINPVAHSSSYGAKHVVAIWIENNTGTFIKTKLRNSSGSTIDHLGTWTTKSKSNVVDATTGATLTSYNALTVQWDGTDVSKAIVTDGDYKVWIEMAWGNNKTTEKTFTSFTFTKGTSATHVAPANTALFTNIALDWVPVATGIDQISKKNLVNVYPNPSNGLVQVDLKLLAGSCTIQIVNEIGRIVQEEKIAQGTLGVKTFDLSKYSNGIYLVNILQTNKADNLQYKILLNK